MGGAVLEWVVWVIGGKFQEELDQGVVDAGFPINEGCVYVEA